MTEPSIVNPSGLFRGVIIEGVACSGKSTLLRGLLAHPSYVGRPGLSSLVLTEHRTQRVLEGSGPRAALMAADNIELLRSHVTYPRSLHGRLARMSRWQDEQARNPRLAGVFERFHISHVLTYEHLCWEDMIVLDRELADLGFELCLVMASPSELRHRLLHDRAGWGTFLGERGVRGRLAEHLALG